ncbi:MAG: GTPase HflX [Ruminococcaceae bacterium]|nr:GTPase HflX [Oscillospiraceae bacterium]
MTEKEIPKPDRAVLVGLVQRGESAQALERSMDELEGLLNTAGGECVARLTQSKEAPDARTMIGSGKAAELAYLCACNDVDLVVFDCELSPSQIRNLENIVGDEVRVIDRSMLILDIFALHAVTGEGKLQVELAQLKYTAPRLMGRGTELSRLGGGIGTRGPGESQLETDRRHLQRRIRALEAQIDEMEKNRKTMRASRDRSGIVQVAIVGYTNAGKSTLLNALTDAGILAEDKLFATLDPTTRKYELPCGESVLLTDTVGFINKLPHHLISAFHSTLEEACMADVLLIIIDASDPRAQEQLGVTEKLLEELGAVGKPTLYVFNKCDRGFAELREIGRSAETENVAYISALTGQGMDNLVAKIEAIVTDGKRRVTYFIPNSDAGALNTLYRVATVENVEYGADGITALALADAKARGMMKKYALDDVVEKEEDWE